MEFAVTQTVLSANIFATFLLQVFETHVNFVRLKGYWKELYLKHRKLFF